MGERGKLIKMIDFVHFAENDFYNDIVHADSYLLPKMCQSSSEKVRIVEEVRVECISQRAVRLGCKSVYHQIYSLLIHFHAKKFTLTKENQCNFEVSEMSNTPPFPWLTRETQKCVVRSLFEHVAYQNGSDCFRYVTHQPAHFGARLSLRSLSSMPSILVLHVMHETQFTLDYRARRELFRRIDCVVNALPRMKGTWPYSARKYRRTNGYLNETEHTLGDFL